MMKRILSLLLAFACVSANAQFSPGQVLSASQLNYQFSLYVPIAGGTLTGPLTVPTLTVTAVNPSLLFQYSGTGSVARSYQSKFQDSITPTDCGAVGNGIADDTTAVTACDAIASSAGIPLTIDRTYLVSGSPTLSANLKNGGGRIKWASGTLTENGRVDAPDNAGIFDYPATAHLTLTSALNSRVSVGWLYGLRDGSLDVSRFMNDAIASAPASGRQIYIPAGFWRLKAETVQIGMQNFITINGENYGERSQVEYNKAPPVGIGASAQFPGGGSALWVDASLSTGIQLQVPTGAYASYRTSALTISNLHISGALADYPGFNQTGIDIEGATDGTVIKNVSLTNFSYWCLTLNNSDAANLDGLWTSESANGIQLGGTGFRGRLSNLSAGDDTESLYLNGQIGWTFTNLNFYPGAYAIHLTNSSNTNVFTNVRIDAIYVGTIYVESGTSNVFNGIYSSVFPTASPDPLGRSNSFGIINFNSADGTVLDGFKLVSGLPTNSAGLVMQNGSYTITGGSITGSSSNQKIVTQSGVTSAIIGKVVQNGEASLSNPANVDIAYQNQLINPTGSSSGQVVVSNGPTSAPTWQTPSNTFSANVNVTGAAGTNRALVYQTSGTARWWGQANTTAESGGNVGSDYILCRASDAGAFIDCPIVVTRSTGLVTLEDGLAVTGAISATTTGAMPLYGTTGTAVNAPHMVKGSVALSSGSATVTLSGSAAYASSSSYVCTANDTTAAAAVKVGQTSGTSITFTGTSTDTVQFHCTGN